MRLGIYEILAAADKEPTKEGKIKVLRDNICQPLIDVLIGAYDDRVKWLLPPGNVPFKPGPDSGAEAMLHSQTRTFYLYVEGGGAPEGVTQLQREVLFIQMLESLDPRDSVLMSYVKDKKLPYGSLTRELIDEAFPKMLYLEGKPIVEEPRPEPPCPPMLEPAEPPKEEVKVKRGRGRPRKHPKPDPNAPKRPRGRPRKDSNETTSLEDIERIAQKNQDILNNRLG